jgi:hypothetical protein
VSSEGFKNASRRALRGVKERFSRKKLRGVKERFSRRELRGVKERFSKRRGKVILVATSVWPGNKYENRIS